MKKEGLVLCLAFVLFGLFDAVSHAQSANIRPIVPCRILDTRVTIGALPANQDYEVRAHGLLPATQGGETTCRIPESAVGILMSVVVQGASSNGWLLAWDPARSFNTPPNASTMNFRALNGSDSSLASVTFCECFTWGGGYDFLLRLSASAHVIIDVVAYYEEEPLI